MHLLGRTAEQVRLQRGVDKAAATLQAEKKQERALLEKQLKAQELQQKANIKWNIKQSTALNKNLQTINKADINNVSNINTSYIGTNGNPIVGDGIVKKYNDFAKTLPQGLTEDELKEKVEDAGLDFNIYKESIDEVGQDLSDQFIDYVKGQYGLIPNSPQNIEDTKLYDETQKKYWNINEWWFRAFRFT